MRRPTYEMNTYKQLIITTLTILVGVAAITIITFGGIATAASGWSTNIDSALKLGKQKKKPVMVEFTGLDWCPPCQRMQKDVFSKSAFTNAASKKFILVLIDIPKPGSSSAKKYHDLMRKYRVSGVPTILLFGEDGREFSRFTASEFPSVEGFLAKLDEELEKKGMD